MAGKNDNVVEESMVYDAEANEMVHYEKPVYEVNEYGQTFGVIDNVMPCDYPDLIGVWCDNDNTGYVYKEDFEGEQPSCPEEAVKMMEERERNGNPSRVINVYESDGRTVIDTFTIG